MKNVRACSFCQGDEAEGYATALALDQAIAGLPVPFPLRVAYSGCPNGCAEPLMQDIGVVKSGNRYDIYAGGRATGVNPRPGRRVAQSLSDHQVVTAVGRLIHFYQQQANKRERFWQFVDQVGSEALIRAAESDE